jgi:hypothetical protein
MMEGIWSYNNYGTMYLICIFFTLDIHEFEKIMYGFGI